MTMNPKTYLQYLQRKAYSSNYSLVFKPMDPKSKEARERIRRAKSVVLDESSINLNYLEQLATASPWARLDPLAERIRKQSLRLVSEQDAEQLKHTVVGFLPTGIINACCVGGLSRGYVVAINYGLFFTANLLSIAFYAPDVTGELLQDVLESVEPEEILRISVNCAVKPSRENYAELERHYSYMTPELLGLAGAFASLIYHFVFLHEVGHICNGDVDNGYALAIFDYDSNKVEYINANHRREYAADKFALTALLKHTTDAVSAWVTFSQVEAFFQFLMYVERSRKISSPPTHPPAISRLRRLREIVREKWGKDEIGYTKTVGVRFDVMGRELREGWN